MKKILLFLLVFSIKICFAQVTLIGITGNTTNPVNYNGTGSLFLQTIATTTAAYVNFEVVATGMDGTEACGSKTQARVILRTTGSNDPYSVVASAPIVVPAICDGKNGSNDKYYVNLKSAINGKPGRYSVEIQADVAGSTNPYDNNTTATTWNYSCPPAYYLSGASGSTGLYYTPPSSCSFGGKSDPIGGPNVDQMAQINNALKYFTVGESANYRDMVVFGTTFYDMKDGKFQPGNPNVPASLNGIGTMPTNICPIIAAPTLSMGAEVNTFKVTNCGSADVTGAKMFYRVYKAGNTPPAYSSFDITFKDDCPTSLTGPEGNTFSMGGSCQNTQNILDQRWQKPVGVTNILPANFTTADAGTWKIDFYTETYLKSCGGVASTQTSTVNTTTFVVNDPYAAGSPCAYVLPIGFKNFNVNPQTTSTSINWEMGATTLSLTKFDIQKAGSDLQFATIGTVLAQNNQSVYNFNELGQQSNVAYYRIVSYTSTGEIKYSNIVKIQSGKLAPKLSVKYNGTDVAVSLNNMEKGNYNIGIIDITGRSIYKSNLTLIQNGNSINNLPINNIAKGIYKLVLTKSDGSLRESESFIY